MAGSVEYDDRTALVVVDMQNDFADPSGSLHVPGAAETLPVANEEIRRARGAGALVVYTKDWHPPTTPHFATHGGKWPVHCVRGTWGSEFHPGLEVVSDNVTLKGVGEEDGYSAFTVEHPITGVRSATGLEDLLHEHGIRHVVIVGLATDYCVRETALDAVHKGFEATVVRDAVRPVDLEPGDGERTLEEMARAGVELV